jgi:flagellin
MDPKDANKMHVDRDFKVDPNDPNKFKKLTDQTKVTNGVEVKIPEISARTLLGREDIEADEFVLAEHFSLMEQNGATKAIDDLDAAMNSLSTIRSYIGSLVNRMEMQTEYLDSREINHSDYVSKISDTDFAKESTELVSAQIKQQAAISILTQSNSRISKVMDILGW